TCDLVSSAMKRSKVVLPFPMHAFGSRSAASNDAGSQSSNMRTVRESSRSLFAFTPAIAPERSADGAVDGTVGGAAESAHAATASASAEVATKLKRNMRAPPKCGKHSALDAARLPRGGQSR